MKYITAFILGLICLIITGCIGVKTGNPNINMLETSNSRNEDSIIVEKQIPKSYDTIYIVDNERRGGLLDSIKKRKVTAQSVKSKIAIALKWNRETIFQEFNPQMTSIVERLDTMKTTIENTNPVPTQLYWEYMDELTDYAILLISIEKSLSFKEKVWETETFFKSGKFRLVDLNQTQTSELESFILEINNFYIQQTQMFPKRKWTFKINTIGYADGQGFEKSTKMDILRASGINLMNEANYNNDEVNLLLSKLRAEAINDFLIVRLRNPLAETFKTSVGKGNTELPPGSTFGDLKKFIDGDIPSDNPKQRIAITEFYLIPIINYN